MTWQSVVRDILESETGDLVALARIAGVNSADFYSHVSLAGVDVRGQDLTSLDLTGCDIASAIMDKATLIAPAFDPRISPDFVRRSIRIPRNLYICIRVFETDANYVYTGWAIKRIIENSYVATVAHNVGRRWTDWLLTSESGQRLISQSGGHTYSLKIRSEYYDRLADSYRHVGGVSKSIRFALLIGLFQHWNAKPEQIGDGSILEFLQKVRKRPSADAKLLSLAKNWVE